MIKISLKAQYDKTLQHLLDMPTTPKSETAKQIKSFTKSKEKIFTFLLDAEIPADNNASAPQEYFLPTVRATSHTKCKGKAKSIGTIQITRGCRKLCNITKYY